MRIIHKSLAAGRWNKFTFFEQMANVGSEIERTIAYKNRSDNKASRMAFERGLELLDFTIADPKNRGGRLKELCRTREALADHFWFDNEYKSTDAIWQKYFFAFAWAARKDIR
ncbi:MAG: hypothetical protein CEN89_499 [Candidatus Berkelbacteria bacterium Licking1014_7]|uniref:Uncharacterized protein n=1 Tax=Candidatus Berkelbacteria bacterium Licking1014_7 TaxID=2017147 RepID=A0A554LIL1_9BACT|nr:MAG: hypothetical protein CEN89_499 [Candidatus Berkelbacteria bacterium Licking1014_7]